MKRPIKRNKKKKNQASCSRFNNGIKSLMVAYRWITSATNLDLYLSIPPLDLYLTRQTHLPPTKFWVGWDGTNSHVSLAVKALYSSNIASCNLECQEACLKLACSTSVRLADTDVKHLGLTMPNLEWVCIWWMLAGGGPDDIGADMRGVTEEDICGANSEEDVVGQ